jgi:hypothetical protein
MLQGNARRGAAVLADLETARLELTWVSWPGRTPPSLKRSIKKQLARLPDAAVRPADHWPLRGDFRDATELISETPEEVRLVANSLVSRRVIVIRFSPFGLRDRESLMYGIADSLADVSDQPMVPWAVYGFVFAVPQGFGLSASRLQTGSAYLSFAGRRGETLRVARVSSAGRLRDDVAPVDLMSSLEQRARRGYAWDMAAPSTQLDHPVTIRQGVRPGWSRLRRRSERYLDTATWYCTDCDRVFEIMRRGPHPDDRRVREMLGGVVCHERGSDHRA